MGEQDRKVLEHLPDVDKTGIILRIGEPSINNPDEWAAVLICKEIETQNEEFNDKEVQIAKMDNAHGTPHLHRYFENGEKEMMPYYSLKEAAEYLERNSEKFIKLYYQ